jgi:hypothetical protein
VRRGSQPTRYRHGRLADTLGLVLVDGVLQEVEVDMQEVLDAAMDPSVWEDERESDERPTPTAPDGRTAA